MLVVIQQLQLMIMVMQELPVHLIAKLLWVVVAEIIMQVVGLMEAAIGIGLLLGNVRTTAVVAGMVVLTVYALAIGFNLLRGRSDIDCGCSGPGSQQPISWHLVVRNIFLVTLAGATLVAMPLRALVWIDWLTTICASLLAIVIYQGCGILLENQLKLNEMRRGT